MKTKKLIGLLVACGGVVASFATASALYTKGVSDVGFGIGATYTAADGSIAYKIDGKSSGSITPTFTKLNGDAPAEGESITGFCGEYVQAVFEFPVSATYSVNPQPYVVGNFGVQITNIKSSLKGHLSVWVQVKGFTGDYEGKWGESTDNSYFCYHETEKNSTHFYDDEIGSEDESYSRSKDIAVSASGEQSVFVYVKLDSSIADADMLGLAEESAFSISATWKAPSADYKFAYIVGDKTQWQDDDAYAMVPNLKTSSFEWYFGGLSNFGGEAKPHKGAEYSSGDNAQLDGAKTYNVSWTGNTSGPNSAASFVEVE